MINKRPQPIPVGRPIRVVRPAIKISPAKQSQIVVRPKTPILIPPKKYIQAQRVRLPAKPANQPKPRQPFVRPPFKKPSGQPITTKPLFMSLHTGGGYAEQVAQLVETLEKFHLEYVVVARDSTGNWERNCNLKPGGVSEIINKYPDRSIVWADADSRVCRYPELLMNMPDDVDIAYHLHRGHELISSLLYFGATPKAKEIVKRWIEKAKQYPTQWDQKLLWKVLVEMGDAITTVELPQSYACIFDRHNLKEEEIVIKQLQYSRKSKRSGKI